jgi:hypothetical protein
MFIGNLMWYHWLNDNDDHISKAMKSILIGNQLKIPITHIFKNIEKKNIKDF